MTENHEVYEVHERLILTMEDVLARSGSAWQGSKFERMRSLQIDSRGTVGELLVLSLLNSIGRECEHGREKDREKKHWDIRIPSDGMSLEVKTATLTAGTKTFQHEGIEKGRSWNGLVFLDIAPEEIYLSCISKKTIDWKSLHRRAASTAYKYDIKLSSLIDGAELHTVEDFERMYVAMVEEEKS